MTGHQPGVGPDSVVRAGGGAGLHAPHTRQRGGGGEEPAEERRLRPLASFKRQARDHQGRGLHGRRLEDLPVGQNKPGAGRFVV